MVSLILERFLETMESWRQFHIPWHDNALLQAPPAGRAAGSMAMTMHFSSLHCISSINTEVWSYFFCYFYKPNSNYRYKVIIKSSWPCGHDHALLQSPPAGRAAGLGLQMLHRKTIAVLLPWGCCQPMTWHRKLLRCSCSLRDRGFFVMWLRFKVFWKESWTTMLSFL